MVGSRILRFCYRVFAKPSFFRQDPETIHDRFCSLGAALGRNSAARWLVRCLFQYTHPALEQDVHGIRFPNPVGLAAGFDKNATLTAILPCVGFGFEEVGSITGEPCEGNPKPRLWRLPKSNALVVHYGLKNDGCESIARRLQGTPFAVPIGISIAKTNHSSTIETRNGIADYVKGLRAFLEIGQYFTINISCPNAFGGEPFTDPTRLDNLLSEIDRIETKKPIFIKMPSDTDLKELDSLIVVMNRHRVHGVVVSNLTKRFDRPEIQQQELTSEMHGGISGKPTHLASNALISHLYKQTCGRYTIIGCGGIFSAEDAYEKIRQGASLVQLITGMIFEGPQLIGEINHGLVKLLQRDGFTQISQAVGSAHKKSS